MIELAHCVVVPAILPPVSRFEQLRAISNNNNMHVSSIVASINANIVTNIQHNECFKFTGGVQTKDGHTWYELQDVHGHHVSKC